MGKVQEIFQLLIFDTATFFRPSKSGADTETWLSRLSCKTLSYNSAFISFILLCEYFYFSKVTRLLDFDSSTVKDRADSWKERRRCNWTNKLPSPDKEAAAARLELNRTTPVRCELRLRRLLAVLRNWTEKRVSGESCSWVWTPVQIHATLDSGELIKFSSFDYLVYLYIRCERIICSYYDGILHAAAEYRA